MKAKEKAGAAETSILILFLFVINACNADVITFSEFPIHTSITNQYSNHGIIFGGDSPFIDENPCNPTAPVLAGYPAHHGAIEANFVDPADGVTPITVQIFSLDMGCFDELGTVRIEWFNADNDKIGEQINSVLGIEHITIMEPQGIARWRIEKIAVEPLGFSIDNVEIDSRNVLSCSKVDDVNAGNCVRPGSPINYTIAYDFGGDGDTNVTVIDYLPAEVDYNSSTGDYNASDRTVRWNLGTLNPPASGILSLSVIVNNTAVQGGNILNTVIIESDHYFGIAEANAPVCLWGDYTIVYVDADAENGFKDGSSWDNAFTDVNVAISVASQQENCEIWVAAGTYKPPVQGTWYPDATFEMPSGNLAIRGHFGGIGTYETSPGQRNFNNLSNETILDGRVGPTSDDRAAYVVTCYDIGDGLTLDGFTFTGGYTGLGIDNQSDPSIIRCKFNGNSSSGIEATNYSYPDIADSVFLENGSYGIYSEYSSWPYVRNCVFDGKNTNRYGLYGNYSPMLVEDCIIKRQSSYGMNFTDSDLTVNNCRIEDNASDGINCSSCFNVRISDCNIRNNGSRGIYCDRTSLEITNCTIQGNSSSGIWAQNLTPTISNNKIFNNKGNGIYMYQVENPVIKNNLIHHNGDSLEAGLYLEASISPPFVRGNTIVSNAPAYGYGIFVFSGRDPCLANNIIWQNGSSTAKNVFSNNGSEGISASYNCIGGGFEGGIGNLSCNPQFRNPAANDYHLSEDSNCINAGDPCSNYDGEHDIDNRSRVIYKRIDIGADEWYDPPDYNFDGVIDFLDFVILASAWGRTDVPDISLDLDSDVDIDDLAAFSEGWLWNVQKSESDFNKDDIVNFLDFATLANKWKNGADTADLRAFCQDWLWELQWK